MTFGITRAVAVEELDKRAERLSGALAPITVMKVQAVHAASEERKPPERWTNRQLALLRRRIEGQRSAHP
jgi:hypothetical protein